MIQLSVLYPHRRLGNSCEGTCPLADLSGPDVYKWIESRGIIQAAPLCDLPLSSPPLTGPSVCLSACPSVCLSACQPACLSLCLSVCLPDSLPQCLSTYIPACLSVAVSVCPSVRLSVCLPVFLSVGLSLTEHMLILYRCVTRRRHHLPR